MYLAKGDRTREVEAAGLLHKYTDFLLFSLITHSLSRYLLLYAFIRFFYPNTNERKDYRKTIP